MKMTKKEKRTVRSLLRGEYIDEKCPRCLSRLIGNAVGEKWCSHVQCDFGIVDFTRQDSVVTITKIEKPGTHAGIL